MQDSARLSIEALHQNAEATGIAAGVSVAAAQTVGSETKFGEARTSFDEPLDGVAVQLGAGPIQRPTAGTCHWGVVLENGFGFQHDRRAFDFSCRGIVAGHHLNIEVLPKKGQIVGVAPRYVDLVLRDVDAKDLLRGA